MTDRRASTALGIGALACVACCLWPFAIAAIAGGITGFLVSPVGWLVMATGITLGVIAIMRRTRRGNSSVPVESPQSRDRADR